ncbi:hypothetical protein Tco_0688899 [Tanacetum coccineum]
MLFNVKTGRISIRHYEMLKRTTLNVLARSLGINYQYPSHLKEPTRQENLTRYQPNTDFVITSGSIVSAEFNIDGKELDKEYNDCQIHRPLAKKSVANLSPHRQSPSAILINVVIDIAGPFPKGPVNVRILNGCLSITSLKGNEAKAVATTTDLIEERKEQAAIQEAKIKKKMEKYYNSRVRGTSFKPGDMVYRNNEASHAKDEGKLGPKWEGPYEVKESLGKGAYKLKDCKGNEMPRTWNICNLKKCYIHEL